MNQIVMSQKGYFSSSGTDLISSASEYTTIKMEGETECKTLESDHDGVNEENRVRQLTEKGNEMYLTKKQSYSVKLEKVWADVAYLVEKCISCEGDTLVLRSIEKTLSKNYFLYREIASEYGSYLAGTRSHDSLEELETLKDKNEYRQSLVNKALAKLDHQIQSEIEKMSLHAQSSKSGRSHRSGRSEQTLTHYNLKEKKMIAEKTIESTDFVRREAGIRKQQALLEEEQQLLAIKASRKKIDLETDLLLLQQEKEAALAKTELKIIQDALSEDCDELKSQLSNIPAENIQERTQQYVEFHQHAETQVLAPAVTHQERINHLDANAPSFHPHNEAHYPQETVHNTEKHIATTAEFTRFFLRKELLFSRFTKYDDKPESYAIWQTGFKSIIKELDISAIEELDLLIKWLGTESVKHAQSLRAANVHDPVQAVTKIWQRLDERYGSPEAVEYSLKNRLNSFPKLHIKENRRLYELSDLVAEIESAKHNEKYRTLLAYFDSSSGVIPIVDKLPYTHNR